MKITTEIDEVNFDVLNNALKEFSEVLNNYLIADGNIIKLEEKDNGYPQVYKLNVSVEWVRKQN